MLNRESGHDTTDKVAGKAHEAVDKAADGVGKAEEYARKHGAQAEEQVREAAAKGRKQADEALNYVTSYVRDNPVMSVGIAFVAGALYSSFKRNR